MNWPLLPLYIGGATLGVLALIFIVMSIGAVFNWLVDMIEQYCGVLPAEAVAMSAILGTILGGLWWLSEVLGGC